MERKGKKRKESRCVGRRGAVAIYCLHPLLPRRSETSGTAATPPTPKGRPLGIRTKRRHHILTSGTLAGTEIRLVTGQGIKEKNRGG